MPRRADTTPVLINTTRRRSDGFPPGATESCTAPTGASTSILSIISATRSTSRTTSPSRPRLSCRLSASIQRSVRPSGRRSKALGSPLRARCSRRHASTTAITQLRRGILVDLPPCIDTVITTFSELVPDLCTRNGERERTQCLTTTSYDWPSRGAERLHSPSSSSQSLCTGASSLLLSRTVSTLDTISRCTSSIAWSASTSIHSPSGIVSPRRLNAPATFCWTSRFS